MNLILRSLLRRLSKGNHSANNGCMILPRIVADGAMRPAISIMMPSLNQSEFIEDAIHSIFDQANETDLELIVIDGGSTDGTQSILADLALTKKGRLRWYSEIDNGPASAVNRALALARGEFIGWLNADDLYAPGAISRGCEALRQNPNWMMVYGHGKHISRCGEIIGDYPTLEPDNGDDAFADGCFICQPTAFFRRTALNELGGLDESLKTAFDLDLWLRVFRSCKNKIGFIDKLQAYSRLHKACITQGQREQVIRESMQVISQYMSACPAHWFYTFLDEFLSNYPHMRQIHDLPQYLARFAESIQGYVSHEDYVDIQIRLRTDERIRIATPHAYLEIYSDGWLPPLSKLRVRSEDVTLQAIELVGERVHRRTEPLQISVQSSDGTKSEYIIGEQGKFNFQIELTRQSARAACWDFRIEATGGFIPNAIEPASSDTRELACKIHGLKLIA